MEPDAPVEPGGQPVDQRDDQRELQDAQERSLQLDAGWTVGPTGLRTRSAARVILVDEQDRVLLVRGHDADEPTRHWWFTVGGGIDPGETSREAAVREVFEESGLRLSVEELVGPVVTRSAIFDFARESCLQHEEFFYARVTHDGTLVRDGWTEIEAGFIDEMAWTTTADLRSTEDEVFPRELADIVDGLLGGWDGVVRAIGLERD
ncbi:ADP-ribose pyrophosphatase [Sanguibacter keddieii DSM 10542]|uniref:ADP-ribose pyrophosphatase n=1 Tax=Sanguibacter keddieii (strain ATCC 51767 / DSM 10542 / NCFB 3025 / ST-74) TaxID=446469 RepID=D1BGV4_SANKS|nr:NUDIX domain-containing protein [Sanguibacter keddieii]ACZ21674.1 ADP-ribose pyrophosphatase [Sanguibacter keddieii DSM 10542]